MAIIAIAVATRIVAWWNPVAHVDDQFYLLAGEELLKGHWPYVDVWDRKPPGLFLLYAGIAWLSNGSIVVVLNIIATAFAAGTAWLIRHTALHFATAKGATLAALAYLFVIPLVGGQTGQSPVFYNLLMVGAACLLIGATRHHAPEPISRRATLAMALCGLAMTIKQISFIEGSFFGLAFLWLLHRQGQSVAALALTAVKMVLIALAPTALAVGLYAAAGELDIFLFSTVTSIFLKSGWSISTKLGGLLFFVLHLGVLLLFAAAGWLIRRGRNVDASNAILTGWLVAALLGYFAIPHFFDHYALPVVVPLSVSAATFFDRQEGRLYLAALAAFCVIQPPIRNLRQNMEARAEFKNLSKAVEDARRGGCIYIGDGPTRLYSATQACSVTRYLFPDHLNLLIEEHAVGIDTGAEFDRILASRPAVIVTQDRKMYRYSGNYRRFLDRVVSGYRRVYMGPIDSPLLLQRVIVWQRNDLASPRHLSPSYTSRKTA